MVQYNIGSFDRKHEKCRSWNWCTIHLVMLLFCNMKNLFWWKDFSLGLLKIKFYYWQSQHQWMGNDDITWFHGCSKVIIIDASILFFICCMITHPWEFKFTYCVAFEYQMSLVKEAQKTQSSRSLSQCLRRWPLDPFCFCFSYFLGKDLLIYLPQIKRWLKLLENYRLCYRSLYY
jgi:hypothetical protein